MYANNPAGSLLFSIGFLLGIVSLISLGAASIEYSYRDKISFLAAKELLEKNKLNTLYKELLDTEKESNDLLINFIMDKDINVLKKFINHPSLNFSSLYNSAFAQADFEKQKILYKNKDVKLTINNTLTKSFILQFTKQLQLEKNSRNF